MPGFLQSLSYGLFYAVAQQHYEIWTFIFPLTQGEIEDRRRPSQRQKANRWEKSLQSQAT